MHFIYKLNWVLNLLVLFCGPAPCIFIFILVYLGVIWVYGVCVSVGLCPAACSPCTCPAARLKREPESVAETSVIHRTRNLTSQRPRSWSDTHHVQAGRQAGQDSNLPCVGEEEAINYRGHDIKRAPWLPGGLWNTSPHSSLG